MMATVASRLIDDNDVCFVGTGLPMIAAYAAKASSAPNATLLFESGILDPSPRHLAVGVGDSPLLLNAQQVLSMRDVLAYLHGGRVTLGFLGAAQIDQHGNVNTTRIDSDAGDLLIRLPGSGGANDIGASAHRTIIMVRHERRKFVKHVDYVTTVGWGRSPYIKGPDLVITDLAVLGFDVSGKMQVQSVHPGVSWDQIVDSTEFSLEKPHPWVVTAEPTLEEVQLITQIDPEGFYLTRGGKF